MPFLEVSKRVWTKNCYLDETKKIWDAEMQKYLMHTYMHLHTRCI